MVSFGAKLFESFMSENTHNTGVVEMPKQGEEELGGHAMCIVGYNDKTRMFAIANSWSKNWGDEGFGFMPYDYIANQDYCGDFWSVRYYSEF